MSNLAIESPQHQTPLGRIGIWLFLASEIMFFMGLLVSYVLFRGAHPQLFAQQSVVMNKWAGGINTLILLTSSFFIATAVAAAGRGDRRKMVAALALSTLLATGFLGVKAWEYRDKLTHYTFVVRGVGGKMTVYDGHAHWLGEKIELEGYAAPMPMDRSWDIHVVTPAQVRDGGDGIEKNYEISTNAVMEQINDGPWKNMFFACYFTLTMVHAVHLIGGIIAALTLLFLATRGKIKAAAMEYVGMYWHFVDLVWIFLFVLLYLS